MKSPGKDKSAAAASGSEERTEKSPGSGRDLSELLLEPSPKWAVLKQILVECNKATENSKYNKLQYTVLILFIN